MIPLDSIALAWADSGQQLVLCGSDGVFSGSDAE
jgi:hypothetical protein